MVGGRPAGWGGRARSLIPAGFWVFGAFAVLDGSCETMNGNWSQLDITSLGEQIGVVDASFMPSIGAVNPGLTIMANAIRVCEYLVDAWPDATRYKAAKAASGTDWRLPGEGTNVLADAT